MNLDLLHTFDHSVECGTEAGTLFRYVYKPEMDQRESPMPYFNPIYTLAGNEVTIFRPHDHLWHKGLAMTASHLSGQNFWGGHSFVRDRGYVQLDNNGSIRHCGWQDMRRSDEQVHLREELEWVSFEGEVWIAEDRQISVCKVNREEGFWALELSFELRNVRDRSLVVGSPTTEGRPNAGYGGLFWRGPRSFLHGKILAEGDLEGPEVMGKIAPWLAFVGSHDGNEGVSTMLFSDHPENIRYPNKWFVRNDPYGCVSFAFTFDEEYTLGAQEELRLKYRVDFADGDWSRNRIEDHLANHPFH